MKSGIPFEDGNDIGKWMQKFCSHCVKDKYENCPIIADLFVGEWPVAIIRKGSSITCSEFEQMDIL